MYVLAAGRVRIMGQLVNGGLRKLPCTCSFLQDTIESNMLHNLLNATFLPWGKIRLFFYTNPSYHASWSLNIIEQRSTLKRQLLNLFAVYSDRRYYKVLIIVPHGWRGYHMSLLRKAGLACKACHGLHMRDRGWCPAHAPPRHHPKQVSMHSYATRLMLIVHN